jgi:hypothetical protein
VDYRSGAQTSWTRWGSTCCDTKWRLILHEKIGLVVYRFFGYAD